MIAIPGLTDSLRPSFDTRVCRDFANRILSEENPACD
jgi:hypothetical protein